MSGHIVNVVTFSSYDGLRLHVTKIGVPTPQPSVSDFPSEYVAAVRDWADAGLQGIHEDYRVPAQLVAYLNEWAHGTHSATDSGRIVARYVLDLLGLDTEGGN